MFLISPASERRFFTASTIWEAHGCLIFEANWEGEKARLEGTSFNDQEVKKIVILKCRLLFLCNECTVQWWFKRFYKGDESLEDEENSGQPSEGDSDQLRGSSKLVILTTTCCVAEELDVNHSAVIWHLKQTGKVKKLISVYLMS